MVDKELFRTTRLSYHDARAIGNIPEGPSPSADSSVTKVESVEQGHKTAQHDDPDLQPPERTPVDQFGDMNGRRC